MVLPFLYLMAGYLVPVFEMAPCRRAGPAIFFCKWAS